MVTKKNAGCQSIVRGAGITEDQIQAQALWSTRANFHILTV